MDLNPSLQAAYSEEKLTAHDAQRQAEFIAWGPVVFQVSRLMVKLGIFEMLGDAREGLTCEEIAEKTKLTAYAVKCLTEASLCIGTILIDTSTDRFTLSKTGWFLLHDARTRVNMDFNHDVNYLGLFRLEEALNSGKPEGLKHFGSWPTIYEGLSSLPPEVQQSWFGFDHFYSDAAFPEALQIIFDEHHVHTLYDVGGNTGKWALRCVAHSKEAEVTVLDLPQQIRLMEQNIQGKPGAERIKGYGIDMLDRHAAFPEPEGGELDAIWMSQFLDCFSMEQIVGILRRARQVMSPKTRLYIMETLWDRQRFPTAAFCLTMTSLYFTAMANGNSKMYSTEDMQQCIREAELTVEHIYDGLGQGHSIVVVVRGERLRVGELCSGMR